MDLAGVDFSTYFVKSAAEGGLVTPATAAQLLSSGMDLGILGYDSAPDSLVVLQLLLSAGLNYWDAYRFLYRSGDPVAQAGDVIAGIHMAINAGLPFPGYLHGDVEAIWNNDGSVAAPPPTIAQLEAYMDTVEAADIRPSSEVQPSIYTSRGVWQTWFAGYNGPASRGWSVWIADWEPGVTIANVQLFGGFTRAQVIGVQTGGSRPSPIGSVDDSHFIARTSTPLPIPPPVPDVTDALARCDLLDAAIDTNAATMHGLVQGQREDLRV